MSASDIPFRLSTSADDADAEERLALTSFTRRQVGHAVLTEDALVFEMDDVASSGGTVARVPYNAISSVVLRPGLLTGRIRLTARQGMSFAELSPRHPREITLLVGRRYRHEAREFVAALQIRVAATQLPPSRSPAT
jgi:hypothetical protein